MGEVKERTISVLFEFVLSVIWEFMVAELVCLRARMVEQTSGEHVLGDRAGLCWSHVYALCVRK